MSAPALRAKWPKMGGVPSDQNPAKVRDSLEIRVVTGQAVHLSTSPSIPKPATWDAEDPLSSWVWRPVEMPRLVFTRENAEMRKLERHSGAKYRKAYGQRCWRCPLYETAATVIGRFDHSDGPLVAFRAGQIGKVSSPFAGFGRLNGALSHSWRSPRRMWLPRQLTPEFTRTSGEY